MFAAPPDRSFAPIARRQKTALAEYQKLQYLPAYQWNVIQNVIILTSMKHGLEASSAQSSSSSSTSVNQISPSTQLCGGPSAVHRERIDVVGLDVDPEIERMETPLHG